MYRCTFVIHEHGYVNVILLLKCLYMKHVTLAVDYK